MAWKQYNSSLFSLFRGLAFIDKAKTLNARQKETQ